ncbi:hypothetical protein HAX54_049440 [Datura stramonium]|uniref:Protein kinase domain-containing protein n=1 Tax=Datura stramonium TaxID=4076 RepID=A0ABS8WQ79_DATST|nr:hypothetical protein [Datura stramonium]
MDIRSPSLVHKNIKSANILLDLELNPHLSDSGLANLIHDADQALNHNTGSGYGAPELDGQHLNSMILMPWHKMVDPTSKGLYPVKSISRFADVIALCVQPEPEFRPPMSEVVEALVRLVQRANMSKRGRIVLIGVQGGETDEQPTNLSSYVNIAFSIKCVSSLFFAVYGI